MSRPLASIGDRFTAQFIDAVIALAVAGGLFYAVRAVGGPLQLAFVGWLAYLLLCDALPGGQSLGKRVTRSAVVHVETEQPCTYGQSLLRNLPVLVLGVLDAAFIVGRQRRRLGDRLARTKVVRVDA